MAMALTLTEAAKRSDLFFISPFDVETKNDLRGRWKAPKPEAILEMAMSFVDDGGQKQPCLARRINDSSDPARHNKPLLVMGFTRCAAARLVREGFTGSDGVHRQDAEFKLQIRIVDSNDQQAFESNIVENAMRNETSPIDDAHNHQKLREQYGYSDADIARKYHYPNQNKVSRLRKLLSYSDDVQLLIHDGKLPVQAAIDLLDLPEDKRSAAILAATSDTGVVNGAEIATQVREHHLSDDNVVLVPPTAGGEVQTPSNPPGRGLKPRTIRELRKFYTEIIEEEGMDEAVVAFCKDMLTFVNGKKSNKQGKNMILRLLEAKTAK